MLTKPEELTNEIMNNIGKTHQKQFGIQPGCHVAPKFPAGPKIYPNPDFSIRPRFDGR